MPEVGSRLAGEAEHERGPDSVRRVQDPQEDPLQVELAAQPFDRAAEQDPARDREGHRPGGKHKQHRHEDQLSRDGRAARDLEVEPERRGVGGDQDEHGGGPGAPVGRELEREHGRAGEERCGEQRDRPELASREPPQAPGASLLDHALLLGVENY